MAGKIVCTVWRRTEKLWKKSTSCLTISQETERKELENRSRWLEICLVIGAGESMTKNVWFIKLMNRIFIFWRAGITILIHKTYAGVEICFMENKTIWIRAYLIQVVFSAFTIWRWKISDFWKNCKCLRHGKQGFAKREMEGEKFDEAKLCKGVYPVCHSFVFQFSSGDGRLGAG